MNKQLLLLTLAIYCTGANSGTSNSTQAKSKSDVATVLEQDLLALIEASRKGDLTRVKALIAAGAQLNIKSEYDSTALHWAAAYCYLEVVKALVSAGADIGAVEINRLPNRAAVWQAIEEALKDRKWSHEF
jgi:ankyrin repeat protein